MTSLRFSENDWEPKPKREPTPPEAEKLTVELLDALGDSYYTVTGAKGAVIGPSLGEYIYKFVEFRRKGIAGSRRAFLGSKPIFSLVGDKIRTDVTQDRLNQAIEDPYPRRLQGWIKGNDIYDRWSYKKRDYGIPQSALEILNKAGLPLFGEGRDFGFAGIPAEEYDPGAFIDGPLPPGFHDR